MILAARFANGLGWVTAKKWYHPFSASWPRYLGASCDSSDNSTDRTSYAADLADMDMKSPPPFPIEFEDRRLNENANYTLGKPSLPGPMSMDLPVHF